MATGAAVTRISQNARDAATDARNRLIVEHLPLVGPIARSIHDRVPPSFDLDDLIQTGNAALCDAAARYRPSEHGGTPFSAWARQKIRGAILDSIKGKHYRNATMQPIDTPDTAVATDAVVIETAIENGRLRRRVESAIAALPAPEQAVLREYYSPAEPDLRAVGVVLQITRGRAKRLHSAAIAHVRAQLGMSDDEAA